MDNALTARVSLCTVPQIYDLPTVFTTQNERTILENIVYLELLRRGFEVHVGKVNQSEVDFIAIGSQGEEYYQVAYTVIDADGSTLERELSPLDAIRDHNPKYLLTMDFTP